MDAKVITLREYSLSFNSLYDDENIPRDYLLDDIKEDLNKDNKIVIVDGPNGIGKTNILLQFAQKYNQDTFTYFINTACSITSKQDYLMEDLGKQIYYYLKSDIPSRDLIINEVIFKELLLDLMKRRKNKPVYIIIDGLDQTSKADVDLLKPILLHLPWNQNNFYFILSGDVSKLREIFPDIKKYKIIRVSRLSLEETYLLFKANETRDKEYVRELHTMWKGLPEDLSQIKTIIDSGISLKNFIQDNEISEKRDLLEKIWKQSNLEKLNFDSNIIQVISIITFNDSIQDIDKIAEIVGVNHEELIENLQSINFLIVKENLILFVSKYFRDFLAIKLKKYESKVSSILINYYSEIHSFDSIINLPNLYERNKEWSQIVKLLSAENFTIVIANSKSFSEIKKQINYGYKASENLSQAYSSLFNFSMYRSTVNGLQKSDNRESQINACISLGEEDIAFNLISNAILREDRLKMLIIYVKQCKNLKINVDESVINEIKDLVSTIDKDYLVENVIDIVTGLAHFLPELAVKTIEEVTGFKSENNSIEWLFGYVAAIFASRKSNDIQDITFDNQTKNSEYTKILDKFTKSLGIGIGDLNEEELISYLSDIENISDKLFIIRKWIKNNKNNLLSNVIIEYALGLLLQNSSSIKPSTTILLDIISPLPYIQNVEIAKKLIQRTDDLIVSINTPTNDKVRVECLIIESTIPFDLEIANERFIKLDIFIKSILDYSVKTEALADCWLLIKNIEKKGKIDNFIGFENYVKEEIVKTVNILLGSTSEHFIELQPILEIIAAEDLDFALSIVSKFNTKNRRNEGVSKCIEIYTNKSINFWDVNKIKDVTSKIDDIKIYTKIVNFIFSEAYIQKDTTKNNLFKFNSLVTLIGKVENYRKKCNLITISITLLSLEPEIYEGLKPNFNKLVKKLKTLLLDFWNKIDDPWEKIETGYKICTNIAKYDKELAKDYFLKAERLSDEHSLNNEIHSFSFFESVRLMIRVYSGILSIDKTFKFEKISKIITYFESNSLKIQLWAELAVKAKINGAPTQTHEIVNKNIIPVLESYWAKQDVQNYYLILKSSASAIYSAQPQAFNLYIERLETVKKEEIIDIVCEVLVTNCHESDSYYGKIGSNKFNFNDAIEFINLIENIETDSLLYANIKRLCHVGQNFPSNFTREQKIDIKRRLEDIIKNKLPNKATGVTHDGYAIVAEASIQYFNIAIDAQHYDKFTQLETKVNKIENISDKSLVYSILASECKNKKKSSELILKAFEEADKIVSVREKIQRYNVALDIVQSISKEIFNEKIRLIYDEVSKLDESEIIPTSRNLIDLAYKVDKNIAQKLISSLDNDPARSHFIEPSNEYYSTLELENAALNDYTKLNQIRNRRQISNIAFRMLGELNSNARVARPIPVTIPLIRSASKLPFLYSVPLFEFFIQNSIKFEPSNSLLLSFFEATYHNAKLCYDLICSISNKDSSILISNLIDSEMTFLALPGKRDEALEYIGTKIKSIDSKDIYIIDPYFSEKDMSFLKDISSWNYGANITVLTSQNRDQFSRFNYNNAWKDISSEAPPHARFINVLTQTNQTPLHDRWIIMYDKLEGIKLGTSLNSIGIGKVSVISMINDHEVNAVFDSLIAPLAKYRFRDFENTVLKYDTFDF